jgi:hypothetical protein
MIALTLEQSEHVLVLIEYNEVMTDTVCNRLNLLGARSYNEPYWHQADTIKSILQAEQRSLRQTVKGGEVQMAAKKKSVAKKPTAKKKAK